MIGDIWNSYRALRPGTQIWVFAILVPVNLASIWFIPHQRGALIAALAVGGMIPNLVLMLLERGFSKAMSFSHLVFWIPLALLIPTTLYLDIAPGYGLYLWVLLVVDLVSLVFDVADARAWGRGNRGIARPQ